MVAMYRARSHRAVAAEFALCLLMIICSWKQVIFKSSHDNSNESQVYSEKTIPSLWCCTRDALLRRHIGLTVQHGVQLCFYRSRFALLVSLLILAGDINPNPGPTLRVRCKYCRNCVAGSGIQRDICDKWIHPECVGLSEIEYIQLGESEEEWFCPTCNNIKKNEIFAGLNTQMSIQGLRVAHINCRSLLGKFSEIQMLLQTCKIDVLGITESHLNERIIDNEIAISGYDMRRCDRTHKKGGGYVVYFREDLNVLPREDLRDRNLEGTWVEVIQKSQRVLIGTVYRAPDDSKFYENVDGFISKVWSKRKNIIIMGDFNSDLLHRNKQTDLGVQGKKLQRILNRHGLKNVIKAPTRIDKSSETLLNLIITGDSSKILKAGTEELSISDHKIVKAKVRTDSLPWITTEVRKKLNRRYRQLQKWQKTKDPSDHRNYKDARNQAKAAPRQAESSYWKTEFEKANNSREFWKTVKKVQRKRILNRIGPIEDEKGVIHTEDSAKAAIMNDFFASVGSNLANNLPEIEHQNCQFITRVIPSLGKIDVDEEYLKKQLRKLKSEKACGPDNVKTRDISMIGNSLLDGLQGLFGRVIISKRIPLDWKCAKLKASFKKGDSKKSGNYRPLSMLSAVN
eukprot:Seg527.9 transcript_id=Seg527.9/GoldUCD/mRNA.D3Y31 product="Retrovirus-related Pol polyprotein from type-1 retrotransposable element R1" pseudo=true protein_id=Seg527.9/GoldUCD/D3Y31